MNYNLMVPEDNISYVNCHSYNLEWYRTPFMRDRDRIMQCTAFKRLAGKTQVYTTGLDDHKKNRLTHSLEVAQISRTISSALGFDSNLAEAIALGHDLGHAPFGHAGEEILHKIMIPNSNYIKGSPLYKCSIEKIIDTIRKEKKGKKNIKEIDQLFGFKHNIQSVRVVSVLEDSYVDSSNNNIGLNLSNYTLWGIMNHALMYYHENDLYPNYQNRFRDNMSINSCDSAEAWSFEAYIVGVADIISQCHHDLEDALSERAISLKGMCQTIKNAIGGKLCDNDQQELIKLGSEEKASRIVLAKISHIVLNTLVSDVIETSKNNLKAIEECLQKETEGLEDKGEFINNNLFVNYNTDMFKIERNKIIDFSNEIQINVFWKSINKYIHHSSRVERMNEKGKHIIEKLFEAYYKHPQQLPDGPIQHCMVEMGFYHTLVKAKDKDIGPLRNRFEQKMKNPSCYQKIILMRRICDYIACMTDRFALEEYRNLFC